jgi:hypothetical protein
MNVAGAWRVVSCLLAFSTGCAASFPVDLDVVLPSSERYGASKKLFNCAVSGKHPAAIVYPQNVVQIQQAILAGTEYTEMAGVPDQWCVRSCGHSYTGSSACNGLVMDVSNLNDIEVDPVSRTVTMGPGVTAGAMYHALGLHGATLPAGTYNGRPRTPDPRGPTSHCQPPLVHYHDGLSCRMHACVQACAWGG